MPQEIIFQGRSAISIDGQSHPITFGENFRPNGEYNIAAYSFSDELGQKSDGCVFEINLRGSTRIMKITDGDLTCQRIAIKGNGWFLGVSPEGEAVSYELNALSEENPLIELSKGRVDCWIAADDGIEVADVSTPPFKPDMEKQIPLDDPSLPPKFVEMYRKLKQIK